MSRRQRGLLMVGVSILGATISGCGVQTATSHPGVILAVGAENQYANVISQIGGRYVSVTAIVSNPNTDPHDFEASPSVAETVSSAQLVVQNGVGYDDFMNTIENASANSARRVIDVQTLLGLPASTANPHLWYNPTTMPAVARAIAADLTAVQPAHAAYFAANLGSFDSSLTPWLNAIAHLKATYPGAPVATTEPVCDFMLQAAGIDNMTPWTLQADIMNGVDPSPQAVAQENALLNQHRVRVFVYNQQVVDSLTETFLSDAQHNGIPVVGVYETMPTPGYTYQSWMLAETDAVQRALADGVSTQHL